MSVRRVAQNACLTHLAIEHRLDVDLSSEIEFFCCRLGAFIPLLQDLSKSGRVDLDKVLTWRVSIGYGGVGLD